MNPQWFGDSFDIVKRFFVEHLNAIGYQVFVDPMLTGEWNGCEYDFYRFLNAQPESTIADKKIALFLDPDTGVGTRKTKKYVTVEGIAEKLKRYEIVFCFDQSFSRCGNVSKKIFEKLEAIAETGNVAFYYDSHARFLFASNSASILNNVEQQILSSGMPASRLIKVKNT